MRVLLAIALIAGGAAALPDAADARKGVRKAPAYTVQPRRYQPRYYYYGPPSPHWSERAVCEENAEAEDPSGRFAGYPCWARSTFGRGSSGGRR